MYPCPEGQGKKTEDFAPASLENYEQRKYIAPAFMPEM